MFTLYYTPLDAHCRIVRLMLSEKELDFRLVEEDIWQRREAFFALNPSGDVPVLITDKEQILCGLYAISEYLEEVFPAVQVIGGSPGERAEVRRINEWFINKFDREVYSLIVFEKVFKRLWGYGGPDSEALRAGKHNIRHHFDYLGYLLQQRSWLAGEYLTLADIAAASYISCLDYLGDIAWEYHDSVKNWYALLKSRPSFRPLLEDRVTGFRPPVHYMDPDF